MKEKTDSFRDTYREQVRTKKALIEVIDDLMRVLDDEFLDVSTEYREVGKETEQAVDWKTKEPIWADDEHTVPYFRPIYDRVPLADSELSEEQKAKIAAIRQISQTLIKLS